MKYVWWCLIGLAVLAVIVALVCICIHIRRRRAAKKVRCESEEEKAFRLNSALSVFGFAWCRDCDCITAGEDPWQRDMGYCAEYDEFALSMNMVMDCEPIYFRCNGKNWLMEFWKGQYGCATGAEIGLYYNDEETDRPPEKLFYTCAIDSQRAHMQFSLWKDGKCIMERYGLHWWLTGFLPGEYSRPCDLVMKICICFHEGAMRDAFYRGLLEAGYDRQEICVENNRICLTFDRPKTRQHCRFGRLYRFLVCRKNVRCCKCYLRASRPFCTTLDRISFLGYCFPLLYRKLIRLGMRCSRRRYEKCCRRRRRG